MPCSEAVIIIGAGGHGKVVCDSLLEAGYEVVGFLDDDPKKWGLKINGIKVIGSVTKLVSSDIKAKYFVVAIGNNIIRARLYYFALNCGLKPLTVIHPKSHVSKYARLGQGTVVLAGAIIQTNAIIGDNVIVNTASSIDHDNLILHHACINPQATLAGGVLVGYYATIHTNATITPYRRVGDNSIVGAGAVVLNDVPPNRVYVGVPAKELKKNPEKPGKSLVGKLFNRKYHSIIFDKKYEGEVIHDEDSTI